MNERTGWYVIVAVHRTEGRMEVQLNSRGRPWTTIGGAGAVLRQLQEQFGTAWQLTIVPAVQS
jgi:hypothetical protein